MRHVTCGCSGQLFKLRGIVPAPRLFQQRSVISANAVIISSELALFYRPEGGKGNHPLLSVTSQTILRKSLITSLGRFFPPPTCLILAYRLGGLCNFRMFHVGKNSS